MAASVAEKSGRDPGELRLDHMLIQPFVGATGAYPINRPGGER